MFRFMQRISPLLSPMIASLFLFSSTVSFAQAAAETSMLRNASSPYLLIDKKDVSHQVNTLFDGSTYTKYQTSKAQLIERSFDKEVSLQNMELYGTADYQLSVAYKVNGVWESAKAWNQIDTRANKAGNWKSYSLVKAITTDKVRVSLIPLDKTTKGISEIRFNLPADVKVATKVTADTGVKKDHLVTYHASSETVETNATLKQDFTFQTALQPAQIKKATLSYDVKGVSGGASVIRAINDELAQGGLLIQATASAKGKVVTVTEEINPQWLQTGLNKIKFNPHQGEIPHGYSISNVKLSLATTTQTKTDTPRLVAYAPQKSLSYKEYAYVRGFVQAKQDQIKKITVDGQEIASHFGAFEALVKAKGAIEVSVVATLKDGTKLTQKVAVNTTLSHFQAKSVQLGSAGVSFLNPEKIHTKATVVYAKAGTQTDVTLGDASLKVKNDALQTDKAIKVATLTQRDLPKLDQGMVNVTKGDNLGYRFLPHGIKFDQENNLEIAYDKTKLPKGMSEKDIKTYFFDEETGRWMPLPKVASADGVLISKTDHFTDMINAVIQTPDAPQAKAYGATQIKDLKVANPGAKINLIEAPKANAMGDAQLNYPIEIPAGRQGMAPQLGVSYSSGASNSWMGLGWNLSLPSIGLDTRWGVPRYDEERETETYTIAGQQLSPVAHRSAPEARTADKRFYPRVEGSFNKIFRHGNTPKNYWWEVTAKDGSKSFYGGDGSAFDENAVLTDANGNIAHWALTKTVDVYGNTVTYNYTKVEDTGVGANTGSVQGYQLYVSNINYTGFNSADGAYDVEFIRDRDLSEGRRSDVSIDARLGFKRVTADLLRKVNVKFQGTTFRSYTFVYTKGAFEKTLLEKIEQYDANNALFNTHTFDYFDEVRDTSGNYVAYKTADYWMGEATPPESEENTQTPTVPSVPTDGETNTTPVITPPTTIDNDLNTTITKNITGLQNALLHANANSRVQLDLDGILTQGNSLFHQSKENNGFDRDAITLNANDKSILAQTAKDGVTDIIHASGESAQDHIRVWKAPFTGTVAITAPALLVDLNQDEEADGVRLSIQKQDEVLWSTQIASDDHALKTPDGVDAVAVNAGDTLLFRVQSLTNTMGDVVAWSPNITYTDKSTDEKDANDLPLYDYNAAKDYLANASAYEVPFAGEMHVEGKINKPVTTDAVSFSFVKVTASGEYTVLWEQSYDADKRLSIMPSLSSIAVETGDKLLAYVKTKSNIDFKAVTWEPIAKYKNVQESFIDRIILGEVDIAAYKGNILPHHTVYRAVQNSSGWEANTDVSLKIAPNIPETFQGTQAVRFNVKSNGQLLASSEITVFDGNYETIELNVNQGDKLFFEYYYDSEIGTTDVLSWIPSVIANGEVINVNTFGLFELPSNDTEIFYRGWEAYVYDAGSSDVTDPVSTQQLTGVNSDAKLAADINTQIENKVDQSANKTIQNINTVSNNNIPNQNIDTQKMSSNNLKSNASTTHKLVGTSNLPDHASALSGAKTDGSTFYKAGTFGINDWQLTNKSLTVGGSRGDSSSETTGTLRMVDIDGDSLPDQVMISNGEFGYRKNLSRNGIDNFAPFVSISGVSAFHHSSTESDNSGYEAHGGIGIVSAFVGSNDSDSITTIDIYFSDVNGDGLVDIVSHGVIYYNQISNGIPTFTNTSANTPNPINESGTVSSDGWIEPLTPEQIATLETTNPLHDTVRMWQAPENGIISINAPVALIQDTTHKREAYTLADGVRVAIQHKGIELWSTQIEATDYIVKNPQNVSAISVTKGDRIYFRVNSIYDGLYDQVSWSPTITYTDKTQSVDANGLKLHVFNAADDFLVSGGEIGMPLSGTISIDSSFEKGATSDEVVLKLVKLTGNGENTTVWSENVGQNAVNKAINITQNVLKGESFRFEVSADTNVDWKAISWNPTITYTSTTENDVEIFDDNGNPLNVIPGSVTYLPYTKILKNTTQWVPDSDGTVEITSQLTDIPTAEGSVALTVKKQGKLLAKQKLEYANGVLTSQVNTISLNVTENEPLYLEYHAHDPQLASLLANHASIEIVKDAINVEWDAGIYTYNDNNLFGSMYRNWGQFVYNANDGRAIQPIIESELQIDFSAFENIDPNSFGSNITDKNSLNTFAGNSYDPSQSIFVFMLPRQNLNRWEGDDRYSYLNAELMSASRLGKDNFISSSPVAVHDTLPVRAINQKIKSKSSSFSAGGSFSGISGSLSDTDASNETLTEFIDMNGDRYPDIVGKSQVQYTTMLGSLTAVITVDTNGIPTYSESKTEGATLGGSYTGSAIQSGGKNIMVASHTIQPAGGISGNFSKTDDNVAYALRDMNSDGLPDRVYKNGKVALNIGYSFEDKETWNFQDIQKSSSKASGLSGSLGINIGSNSISFGIAGSKNQNKHDYSLMDINSDGLLDQVYLNQSLNDSNVSVKFNTGNGFASKVAWGNLGSLYENEGTTKDTTGTGTLCMPIGVGLISPFKACGTLGGSSTKGSNKDKITLSDVNGDGYLDFLTSSSVDQLGVGSSTIGKTNLLKNVHRPLGATIMIDYDRSGNTYENPHHKWVLGEVEVFDGHTGDGALSMKQKFTYEEGYYDRYEREFYGFAWVTTTDLDTQNADAIYRKSVSHYINDNYYEKGLLDYTKVTDGADKLYVEKINAYDTINIFTENVLTDTQMKEEIGHITFSKLTQAQTLYYEGENTPGQQTAIEYAYDKYGNVTSQNDLGEFSDAGDNWSATVTYYEDLSKYIVAVPETIKIFDENNNILRDREATIDAYGAVTQVRISTSSTVLTTDMDYDQYGNLVGITYPPNHKGQRYELTYGIDEVVQTYTTSMTDSFGYTATAGYDYRFGAQTSQTDINNQPILTTLDDKGRLEQITGPLEAGGSVATITHSYYPDAAAPYALTEHHDEGRADTIDTVTFIDGLMRVIQTKKDAAIDEDKDGIALDMMSVSGHVKFDSFGRTSATYYPVSEGLGSKGTFNPTVDGIAPTRTVYDILDRKIKTTLPDNATLTNDYGFKSDRDGIKRFHTLSTDANGNTAESFKDVRERITAVLQHNPLANQPDIWTSYAYNAVNELLEVKDDQGHLTQAIYDNAGRRTHINNPDTGWIESIYDDAGNVITKITDNLRNIGKSISYSYDYNRLDHISYPTYTDNNVYYLYGAPGAENFSAGRITKITDGSGVRYFEYGKLGETTKETRTLFTYTGTDPKTYVTKYRYDTWNRLRALTYPDGEVLTHNYDSGGKLASLRGNKGEYSYDYLKALTYDKFGQRVFAKYANDTVSTYSYEAERRRLSNLTTANTTRTFMDNTYGYDKMQNILSVANGAAVPIDSGYFGGETSQSFTYDNLYQLTDAQGSWTTRQGHEHRYNLEMNYDTIGNIKAKKQNHERLPYEGDKWIAQKATTYDWSYEHTLKQPHAPSKIGNRTFTYDLNGNQTGWQDTQKNNKRVIHWDEENRIRHIIDNGHSNFYIYDAGGERTLKRTAQGETFYVNAYFVIRNGTVASKHFFAGSQRVATKLTKQESQTIVTPPAGTVTQEEIDQAELRVAQAQTRVDEAQALYNAAKGQDKKVAKDALDEAELSLQTAQDALTALLETQNQPDTGTQTTATKDVNIIYEHQQYYYHPDHLGSSSFVTDQTGKVYEHLEYFPFGETFAHEHSNTQRTPYRFTGKEYDEVTGLYYYGARYYDPRTSVWQSPDPIISEYMSGETNGGVFNPKNLSLFSYTYNNPVNLSDPDGEAALLGAFIGGGIDVGVQLLEIAFTDKTISDFDGKSVLVSAAAGATGAGIGATIAKNSARIGKIAAVSAETVVDAGISAGSQHIKNGEIEAENVVADVIGGRIGSIAANKVKSHIVNSDKVKQVDKMIKRQTRISNNPKQRRASRIRARQQKLNTLKQGRDRYIESNAVRSGIVAGGIGSTAINQAVDSDDIK